MRSTEILKENRVKQPKFTHTFRIKNLLNLRISQMILKFRTGKGDVIPANKRCIINKLKEISEITSILML